MLMSTFAYKNISLINFNIRCPQSYQDNVSTLPIDKSINSVSLPTVTSQSILLISLNVK